MIQDQAPEDERFDAALAQLAALPIILSERTATLLAAQAVAENRLAIQTLETVIEQWGIEEMRMHQAAADVMQRRESKREERGNKSAQRKLMTATLRLAILQRDGHRCRSCGATSPDSKLHVDHIIPLAQGGKTTGDNLQTLCADCNLAKAAKIVDFPSTSDGARR